MRLPRPCSAAESIQRVTRLLGEDMPYELGTGGYQPKFLGSQLIDKPWTYAEASGIAGCDCAGCVLSFGIKCQRHRPGYAKGGDVEDDINVNSAIWDAWHERDLFEPTPSGGPELGSFVGYRTIRLHAQHVDATGQLVEDPEILTFVGHVAQVVALRFSSWDPMHPRYDLIDIIQCCGPNGRKPAVIRTDGSLFGRHDVNWPKDEHKTQNFRIVAA